MTWTPELIIAGLILLVMIPCQFMNVYKADKAYKEVITRSAPFGSRFVVIEEKKGGFNNGDE